VEYLINYQYLIPTYYAVLSVRFHRIGIGRLYLVRYRFGICTYFGYRYWYPIPYWYYLYQILAPVFGAVKFIILSIWRSYNIVYRYSTVTGSKLTSVPVPYRIVYNVECRLEQVPEPVPLLSNYYVSIFKVYKVCPLRYTGIDSITVRSECVL